MSGVIVMPFFAKKSAGSLPRWLLCAFIQLRVIRLRVFEYFKLFFATSVEAIDLKNVLI